MSGYAETWGTPTKPSWGKSTLSPQSKKPYRRSHMPKFSPSWTWTWHSTKLSSTKTPGTLPPLLHQMALTGTSGFCLVKTWQQQIVWQRIEDCPGAHNIHDDLQVVGADEKEHDENLDRVMHKLEQNGLTLNYHKCEIGVQSMTYKGDVPSGEGLKVSSERVKAITQAPRPQNQSEMRSFLGSVQFCAKFIQGFATISRPLWDLTHQGAEWKWTEREEGAFQELKTKLTQAPVMAYYTQCAKTRVTTDASPVGLGAILERQQEDGLYRPVYYASRKLNTVKRRYSQFEREALGVRCGCQKFYLYLYGVDFEVCTDHKPLVTVLGRKSRPPSARIERWLLYLQQFKYKITHIPGHSNAADVLSRLPVDAAQDDDIKKTEEYAQSIASDSVPAALVPRRVDINPRSTEDRQLGTAMRHYLQSWDTYKPEI